jgi:RNA polymerase sigma-70 factor (ECF subfamily)
VALKAGLRRDEADEVVQETMTALCKHIEGFKAAKEFGSFRAWLLNMARWRIKDQFRKRPPGASNIGYASEETARTPTVERVPDRTEADLEALCDAEWQERLRERALKDLQLEVKAEHYQVFHLLTLEHKSVDEVARMVGRNRAQVYLIRHRVGKELKKTVMRLEKQLG